MSSSSSSSGSVTPVTPPTSGVQTPKMSNTSTPPRLPPSSNTNTNNNISNSNDPLQKKKRGGCLSVTILSVYDLPRREPPRAVTLTACGQQKQSGPPNARHRDRNSFKFTEQNTLEIITPLKILYHADATLTLQYDTNGSQPATNLQAKFQLATLKIQETNWLILNLEEPNKASTNQHSTATLTKTGGSAPEDTPDNNNADGDGGVTPPTIRLQVQLIGPYRAEIAFCLRILNTWFGLIGPIENQVVEKLNGVPFLPKRLPEFDVSTIPVVPLIAVLVMVSPAFFLGMPILVPLVIVMGVGGIVVLLACLILYASSSKGRDHIGGMLAPLGNTLLSTRSGQRLVYQTGARPTPISICRAILPTNHVWHMLAVSLMIDTIGSCSYLLPLLGEGFDLAWAPMQTALLMSMYENDPNYKYSTDDLKNGKSYPSLPALKYVSFLEEILPFTDIIPSATIGWWLKFGPSLWQQHVGGPMPKALTIKNSNVSDTTKSPSNNLTPFNTPLSAATSY